MFAPAKMNETAKKRIVLIEDDAIVADLLTRKLEKAGYAVELTKDGPGGLELARAGNHDLVLLDMMLPKMSGFEVLEKLNEEKIIPALPLVVISNSGQPIEIERAKKLGARDFLIKVNFDPNEVLDMVNRILRGPIREKTEADEPPIEENKDAENGGPAVKILIVEDDNFLIELLEKKLKKHNFKTLRAADAKQARSILASNEVDIILLDIVLPGMDGLTFLAELKADERRKSIPVVILSNLGQEEEKEKGIRAGAVDYIVKAHVTPGEIITKIREVVHPVTTRPLPR